MMAITPTPDDIEAVARAIANNSPLNVRPYAWQFEARAAILALQERGWQKMPTQHQIYTQIRRDRNCDTDDCDTCLEDAASAYRAMIAASPEKP